MVPVSGNNLQANPTPGASSVSQQFSNIFMVPPTTTGNETVVVQATMSNANGRTFTGATYGGQTMTEVYQQNRSGLSQRMVCYALNQAPTGSNTLTITFNGNQFNPISIAIKSFGDCGGVGNTLRTGAQNTPHNGILTIQDESFVMMTSCSVNQILTQQIPTGSNRFFSQHNTNRQVAAGALGAPTATGFPAGDLDLQATSTFGTLTLDRVEIKGLSTAPLNEGNFFKLFI
tara:strand:+ start:2059 stop:2751 length:693 start_codon:yes stop_codon:yes gene_type:complete